MGIDAWLQVDDGDPIGEVSDCRNVLKHFFASLPSDIYPLLSSILPYEDTVFLEQAASALLSECELALKNQSNPEIIDLLKQLKSLIENSTRLPGSVVRFVGD